MSELTFGPTIPATVRDAVVAACEVVGSASGSVAFRNNHRGLGDIYAEATGMPMGILNYPSPRIIGDIRQLKFWEITRVLPRLATEVTHAYLASLAAAALPVFGVDALASQVPGLYLPATVISPTIDDLVSMDAPIGAELFLDTASRPDAIHGQLPEVLVPYFPDGLVRRSETLDWRGYRTLVGTAYAKGDLLRDSLKSILAALTGSSKVHQAVSISHRANSNPKSVAEMKRIVDAYGAAHKARRGRLTFGEYWQFKRDFVRENYQKSRDPLVRQYVNACLGFEQLVFAIKACIIQATMSWPFQRITGEASGPWHIVQAHNALFTRLFVNGAVSPAFLEPRAVVILDYPTHPAPGLYMVDEINFKMDGIEDREVIRYDLKWIA